MAHLAILGAGPAGYVAAIRARQLGADVTLIEKDETLGGTCLNRGCIPSKALLRTAEVARLAAETAEYGVLAEFKGVDWPAAMSRKNKVVAQLVKGIEYLMKQNGVRVVRGKGRLVEPLVIEVETDGQPETVKADKVVLCPGSVSARLPLPGFQVPTVLTSDEMLEIEKVPESLVIIGGGVIGAEFADIFSAVGAKVSILEMLPRIIPLEDEEMSAELARTFRRRKIDVFVNSRVSGVEERGGKRVVRFTQDEKEKEVEAEVVLSAVGRTPNTEGIGLPGVGLETDRRAIKVNARMETNLPGVYACGDAIGGYLLAHVAFAEGKVAVANAVGQTKEMDYRAIPSAVYTHPEVGSVGLSEKEATARGLEIKIGRFHYRAASKAVAEGTRDGMAKIVVDARSGKIVGAHIIGPHATDVVHEMVLAVQTGASAEEVGGMVHAHPSLSEPLMEATEDALGVAIHK
jgi:dihydrolipoamide dehydrogenase